ncbi:MAG TPA: YdcF family protein [Acidimicrobiales bacterium]|jgi:uncharacterized SAM-binding protein YcdF (DUF218 family)
MPRWLRIALRVGMALAVVLVLYVATVFVQVWWAAHRDEARSAQAIVVLGAAQYDGRPSVALTNRLDHALDLFEGGLADVIVVTGGRQEGDRFTEAQVAADYLLQRGVTDEQIRREVHGTNTWESLAATARFLADEGVSDVILVSDDYHSLRLAGISDELGLDAHISPAGSGLGLADRTRAYIKETVAVSVGRLIGYRRSMRLDDVVERVRVPD